uniref:GLTP domain-containing protein n=1 Tax=Rhabditophanes sp. KR3021 TaxID=114890 RepID=A0AC35TGP6_9BILA
MAQNEQHFNLDKVIDHFEQALNGNEDIFMEQYLEAYRELNKIFGILGRIFGFVESDVTEKVAILDTFLANDKANYSSVGTMIKHECHSNQCPKGNGSRTLLRLHRALQFIILFVEGLKNSQDNGMAISTVCKTSYDKTLANYHGFFIRKSVAVAVYTLPSREYIIKGFFTHADEDVSNQTIHILADKFKRVGQNVYDRIQEMYTHNNLLELP